jgi:hypothetical protein
LISLSGNTTVIEAQGAKYVFDHQMIQVVAWLASSPSSSTLGKKKRGKKHKQCCHTEPTSVLSFFFSLLAVMQLLLCFLFYVMYILSLFSAFL